MQTMKQPNNFKKPKPNLKRPRSETHESNKRIKINSTGSSSGALITTTGDAEIASFPTFLRDSLVKATKFISATVSKKNRA